MEKELKGQKATVPLNNDELSKLKIYLLITSRYRAGELEACRSLAEEREPDGSLTYPNMPSNVQFWENMNYTLCKIISKIDEVI